MRIIFYLPLARVWMLENVLSPMIVKLAPLAEVHVMLPDRWRESCATVVAAYAPGSSSSVQWHGLPGDHDGWREAPDQRRDVAKRIVDAVAAIAPDHCLCRSVDATLPTHFPGRVHYIMEASAPPFRLPTHWISLQPQIFDHGFVPAMDAERRARLIAGIAPLWQAIDRSVVSECGWREQLALPRDRKIAALPLDYEHSENLFGLHRAIRPNAALVRHLIARLNDRLFLAVTDHPLNRRFVDTHDLAATIASARESARLLEPGSGCSDITSALVRSAEGVIVGDSKSFCLAAFYGKPLLRMSQFASAPWLRTYDDLEAFATDVAEGRAAVADRQDAKLWFAHYLAAQTFAPREANMTGAKIIEQVVGQLDADRWGDRLERVARLQDAGVKAE